MNNPLFYLAAQSPLSAPVSFEFAGRDWLLWPLSTIPIAMQVERWVCQFVARNVESLRPDNENDDPVAWRIYERRSDLAQKNIERGNYGALTQGFQEIINTTDAGFAEALHQCINYKEEHWNRDMTRRLWNNPEKKAEVETLYIELNFPKKKQPTTQPSVNGQANGELNGQSNGAHSSENQSAPVGSA